MPQILRVVTSIIGGKLKGKWKSIMWLLCYGLCIYPHKQSLSQLSYHQTPFSEADKPFGTTSSTSPSSWKATHQGKPFHNYHGYYGIRVYLHKKRSSSVISKPIYQTNIKTIDRFDLA